MAESKVAVSVDISGGLEAAMANFQRFSGSVSSVQRAMGQFERLGEKGMASGEALTTADYDKMGRALENIKRTETEITKQIQDRRGALAAIDSQMEKIFSKRTPAMGVYEGMIARGFTPEAALRRAMANDLPGAGDLAGLRLLEPQARRLQDEIGRLEKDQTKIGGSLPHAEAAFDQITRKLDVSFDRFLRGFTRVMSLTGLGTATAIAAQGRNRAIEYDVKSADVSAFIGSSANARARGLSGAGDFGVYPMEALDLAESIGAAGGPVTDRMIAKMAGMGLHFGFGRTGFAHMGREAVGKGSFNNFSQFGQFGATAGVLANTYGLEPAQRMFFLESNKNLIEQQARWYGGRPLSVENYFTGVNTLMMAMRHLNLPAGGGPIAAEAIAGISQALSPVGKSFGDVLTQGALLGVSPVPGMGQYLGTQRAINEMMRTPAGFLTAIQGLAGKIGIETGPGANIEGGQLDALMAVISSKFPQMLPAFGQLNTSGVDIGDLLRMQPEALSADIDTKMKGILDETKKAAEESWRRQEINWTIKQIEGIGGAVKWLEEKAKGVVGPNTAAGLSAGASVLSYIGPSAISYFLTKSALSRIVGPAMVGSPLGAEAAAALGWGSKLLGSAGIAGIAALPFTMSGEGMGTTPPKTKWTGNREMTREEFVQLSEMARKGLLPELMGAKRAERPPIPQETLVDAIVGAFRSLMVEIGRLSIAVEEDTRETRSSRESRSVPEARSGRIIESNRPRGPYR